MKRRLRKPRLTLAQILKAKSGKIRHPYSVCRADAIRSPMRTSIRWVRNAPYTNFGAGDLRASR